MATVQTQRRLLNPEELGQLLGLKKLTILKWHRQGKIPSIKIAPRVVRFDPDKVLEAIGAA